ncbi:MAG: Integrase, partial [Herminiimonas sp.]|nr:Integrase [Herminiimonas sp.]
VLPNGSKLWRWKYRLAGKENRYAIGAYPAILLTGARKMQEEARKLVKAGMHPSHQKQLLRLNQATEHANTFQAVAEEWLGANAAHWTHKTRLQRERALEADVYPHIGSLPVRQVTPSHVLDILKRIEKRAPAMAVVVNQSIGAICRLAVVTLRADTDPTGPIRGALKPQKTRHHRPLAPDELPKLIAANEASSSYYPNKVALKLMLLTLARTMEIVGARWDEFDLDAGLWIVPAARMKMRENHLIPLPSQAVQLLQKLRVLAGELKDPFTGQSKPVFPNRNQPSRPASHGVLWKAIMRMGFDERFSPHGIRSTGSTILNGMGYRADLIEKQLAHEERDKSRASYNRATYIEERRTMMQQWADYLDAIAKGEKVVAGKFDKAA